MAEPIKFSKICFEPEIDLQELERALEEYGVPERGDFAVLGVEQYITDNDARGLSVQLGIRKMKTIKSLDSQKTIRPENVQDVKTLLFYVLPDHAIVFSSSARDRQIVKEFIVDELKPLLGYDGYAAYPSLAPAQCLNFAIRQATNEKYLRIKGIESINIASDPEEIYNSVYKVKFKDHATAKNFIVENQDKVTGIVFSYKQEETPVVSLGMKTGGFYTISCKETDIKYKVFMDLLYELTPRNEVN